MLRFSQCVKDMRTSEIRDLMKLATRPDIISFAGGMPNNDLFPIKEMDEIYRDLSDDLKKTGFQYGPTSGFPPLLELLKEYLRGKDLPVDDNEIMITTGSLQAINILSKLFLDPGDRIITENPCFIGGTSAFKSYQAEIDSVPIDEHGMKMDILEDKIHNGEKPKMVYISPYFHNPAGIIYSHERKEQLLNLLRGKDIVLLEDDAYSEIYFDGKGKELTDPLKRHESEDMPICYTGSFSKIFGPGIRLGWMLVNKEIFQKAELTKQSMDACSSTFTQVLAYEFLRKDLLQPYLKRLRETYKRRMELMHNAMLEHMPNEAKWVKPKGGFYIWVDLPENIDATDILKESIDKGAVIVIGKTFDPAGKRNNCFRLAYSHTPEDKIEKGIKIVADAVRHLL